MAIDNYLPEVLETTDPERLATGFIFTEGPLWHPDGYWYFVDLHRNHLHRLIPGEKPELVRKIERLADNDRKYGRNSKNNPNNKPNGK